MENFIKYEKLIPEKEWHNYIDDLEKEVEELIKTNNKNIKNKKITKDELYNQQKIELKNAIIEAIKTRIPQNNEKFAVFFSGGVDSTLISFILKQLKESKTESIKVPDFTCYTVGYKVEESKLPLDIIYAQAVGDELKLKVVTKLFNLEEAEKIIKKISKILKENDNKGINLVVNAGVGAVVVAATYIADEKIFFSGLGSEEIFAGYKRHENAKDKNKECWNGLKQMWKRDLERDFTIGKALKIDVRTPFMDENVIKIAMLIDANNKINKEHKKIVLREIAEEMGLNPEYSWRKKLGAQYGSKFDRAIEKLAKTKGFKTKDLYLEGLKR